MEAIKKRSHKPKHKTDEVKSLRAKTFATIQLEEL